MLLCGRKIGYGTHAIAPTLVYSARGGAGGDGGGGGVGVIADVVVSVVPGFAKVPGNIIGTTTTITTTTTATIRTHI